MKIYKKNLLRAISRPFLKAIFLCLLTNTFNIGNVDKTGYSLNVLLLQYVLCPV